MFDFKAESTEAAFGFLKYEGFVSCLKHRFAVLCWSMQIMLFILAGRVRGACLFADPSVETQAQSVDHALL